MRSKGFTIIELIISIFILTVGISAVLYMFPLGTQVQKSSQMATVAIQLSQGKMEEIISKSYSEIVPGIIEEDYGFDSDFSSYRRQTEISYFDPVNPQTVPASDLGIKKVQVTVFWRSPLETSEKEIKLITLFARK
jgi:prepilin-type N-terminal cleavage/methylation domain-containing protein